MSNATQYGNFNWGIDSDNDVEIDLPMGVFHLTTNDVLEMLKQMNVPADQRTLGSTPSHTIIGGGKP